jgi:hypothetical protein
MNWLEGEMTRDAYEESGTPPIDFFSSPPLSNSSHSPPPLLISELDLDEVDSHQILRTLGLYRRMFPPSAVVQRAKRTSTIAAMSPEKFAKTFTFETWTNWCNFDPEDFLRSMPRSLLTDEMILCAVRRSGRPYIHLVPMHRMHPVILEAIIHYNPDNLDFIPPELVTMDLLVAAATGLTFTDKLYPDEYQRIYKTKFMQMNAPIGASIRRYASTTFAFAECHLRKFGFRLVRRVIQAFYPDYLVSSLPDPSDLLGRTIFSLFSRYPMMLVRHHNICMAILVASRPHQRIESAMNSRVVNAHDREWKRLENSPLCATVRNRAQAHLFMLVRHERCGKDSKAQVLVDDVLELICKYVVYPDDSIYAWPM